MLAIAFVLVAGMAIKFARRSPPETPQQRVRRLLSDMAYQPSDLDFHWSASPSIRAKLEMERLGVKAVPCLIECLNDPDWSVRCQAVACLSEFNDSRVIPALKSALLDPDGQVCATAMRALIKSDPQEAVEPIIAVLNHPAWFARLEAVNHLATLGDRRAIDPLRRICGDKAEVDSTRQEATNALRRLGADAPPLPD
jgi:HEAT repeat protein